MFFLANPDIYRYTTLGTSKADFACWFSYAQRHKAWAVVRLADNQAVGSTRLYRYNLPVGAVNVGYTWYAPECLGTGINSEVKLLLLMHVFEKLKFNRVQFDINADNTASRKAVEKLGAQLEGILRQHRLMANGELADSCIYALLAAQWHSTKKQLQEKTGIQ